MSVIGHNRKETLRVLSTFVVLRLVSVGARRGMLSFDQNGVNYGPGMGRKRAALLSTTFTIFDENMAMVSVVSKL